MTPHIVHISFNPLDPITSFGLDPLMSKCKEWGDYGYALIEVVEVHENRSIAVFERRVTGKIEL